MTSGSVDDLRRAQRVLCLGCTGSGKSTLAVALGARLGLPVTLMDNLMWDPDGPPVVVLDRPRGVRDLLRDLSRHTST